MPVGAAAFVAARVRPARGAGYRPLFRSRPPWRRRETLNHGCVVSVKSQRFDTLPRIQIVFAMSNRIGDCDGCPQTRRMPTPMRSASGFVVSVSLVATLRCRSVYWRNGTASTAQRHPRRPERTAFVRRHGHGRRNAVHAGQQVVHQRHAGHFARHAKFQIGRAHV